MQATVKDHYRPLTHIIRLFQIGLLFHIKVLIVLQAILRKKIHQKNNPFSDSCFHEHEHKRKLVKKWKKAQNFGITCT